MELKEGSFTKFENRTGQTLKPGEPRPWYAYACITILVLALTSSFENSWERAFTSQDEPIPVDFPVFYMGGKVALQGGATPLYYPPADRSQGYKLLYKYAGRTTAWAQMARASGFPQILQFTNPPFSAVLMVPLAMMRWQWAFIVWEIIIIVLTALALFMTLRLLPSGPDLVMFALMFAAVCFFFPFRNTLAFGQANASILFTWALGVYLFKQQRPVASALSFALGTVLKVSPVVAVPFFALRRQWRWLAAYVAGIIAFTGASIEVLGWETNRTWLTAVYPGISSGLGNTVNRSFAGFLNVLCGPQRDPHLFSALEWPVPPGLSLFEKTCSIAMGLGFLYWCWRKRKDAKGLIDELILLPLIYLLAAPFSWPHHFILAILPLSYLWAKAHLATSDELVALSLGTMVLGTEVPIHIASLFPVASPYLITLAIGLWPAATCAIIWAGMRMYLRSPVFDPQPAVAV